MRLTIKSLIILCGFFLATTVSAQKFGYLNSQLLLSEMPEVKQANSNLEAFSKQLQKKGEAKITAFQKKVQAFQQKQEAGQYAPVDLQAEGAKLQAEEKSIIDLEKQMQQDVLSKRQTLLKPIYDRVDAAIKAVAEENGFQYIFDIGAGGALLYADESLDVTAKVKAKL